MRHARGTTLLLLLISAYLAFKLAQGALHAKGGPPPFFQENRHGIAVMLGKGFPNPGVHQFSDTITPLSVIKMTGLETGPEISSNRSSFKLLEDGEALVISVEGTKVVEIKRFWMSARQRMTLGIPLHPERMSLQDWEDLPGIGPRTAQMIEKDRQENDEFASLDDLRRVRGIGPGRIQALRKFFE